MRLAFLPFLCALVVGTAACTKGHPPTYRPRDTGLASEPLYFYPASDSTHRRAFLFYFGNDVGFWGAHERLAYRLSTEGYDVVGLDLRKWLGRLPTELPRRDSAVRAGLPPLIARARAELRDDALPLVLGGHSFGAEIAIWTAHEAPPERLVGVLAMSPRSTGHLIVVPEDLLNYEASGPGSFSTIQYVAQLPVALRVAVIRGEHDKFRKHDSAFVAAGGNRLNRYLVPWASHSMQGLTISGILIERGLGWIVAGAAEKAVAPPGVAGSGGAS
ncbi:MAG: hypothetical protein NVS4B3_08670 [Gemmatimonadaceae bacterium]